MNTVILSLLLAVQSQPAHAELHPANADICLSVPDVQAVVDAYGNAPVLQTINDSSMHELLAAADGGLEGDPRTVLKAWIERIVPSAGAMVDEMTSVSFSFTLDPESDKAFGIELVASFSTPEQALAAQKLALEAGPPVGPFESPGLTGAQRFTSAAMEGMELWSATIGERFLLGGGSTTAEGVSARLRGDAPGLAGSELLKRAGEAFGEGSGATVFWLVQRRSPIELLGEVSGEEGLLGGGLPLPIQQVPAFLDPLAGEIAMRMQLRGHRFVTEMFSPAPAGAGALGGQPIQPEWLRRVPADAMFAYATAVDGKRLAPKLSELFAFLGEASAPELADLLEGLGPGMVAYMFPVSGIGAPQTHVSIDAKDAAKFTAGITSLCARLAETQPGITARTRDYKVKNQATGERLPFPVTTITLPPEVLDLGPMFPSSLAFAEVDGKILFGLSSMNLKRELKRLYGGEESEDASDPWARNGFSVPEDARSVILMDWGMQIEAALTLARALGSMAGDQVPFDLNALPDAKAFTKYLRPTFHVSRDVEGGTYRYHEASFGPETWIAIAGLLFG